MPTPLRREDPPYLQVTRILRERIQSGALRPGDPVPSERAIVAEWGISRTTATKVLATLRADGLVEAQPGRGTVVRSSAGLADFTLNCDGRRNVLIRHTTCKTTEPVTTLNEAHEWARSHRCPT